MGRSYIRNVGTGSIYNESGEIMAGQIVFCAGNSIPNGYLECNGATVSRTTYATLFAAIGSTYGPGDGATTFALPDLRGEFLRGADRGRGVDSGRAVGSSQNATRVYRDNSDPTFGWRNSVHDIDHMISADFDGSIETVSANTGLNQTSTGTALNKVNGVRVRPRNVAMIAAIKYS
jgi:microcystin-dependent protein